MRDWRIMRLSGEPLLALAAQDAQGVNRDKNVF
jgi:hypothetical protein